MVKVSSPFFKEEKLMATQKIFAQHNAKIDLSALGNKNQIQVVISGPDLN